MAMFEAKREPLVWIQLKDGIRLAAKLWIPLDEKGKNEQKFPAILGKKKLTRIFKSLNGYVFIYYSMFINSHQVTRFNT